MVTSIGRLLGTSSGRPWDVILPSGMVAEMNHKSLVSCSFMFTLVFLYNLTINSK